MSLADLEAWFFAAVTDREPPSPSLVEAVVTPSPALSPVRRLGIYRGMYFARLYDALREDFAKTAALVGEDTFMEVAAGYLAGWRSRSFSIGGAGEQLPAFLATVPLARPDVADVARLEWARCEVFDEADARGLDASALGALPPERLASARLTLAPALRLLTLEHDVVSVWRAIDEGREPPPVFRRALRVAVFRRGFAVVHVELDPSSARALELAACGNDFATICEAFASEPDSAAAAFACIGAWLAEGWIRAVD
jgi:hypothetical protein